MTENTSIAITGAAGFIGSTLAHRLAGSGRKLLLIDHPLPANKARNLAGLGHFEFLTHDRFLERLGGESPEIEAIFHLGACSSTTEGDWNYLRRNNIEYSQAAWNWCVRNRRPFYYASSAATYGDGSRGFDDRTRPEDLEPLNLYGKSKNDFDLWVLEQVDRGEATPPGWAGLKFFNVYGPRESHKAGMASVVWRARSQAIAGEVTLFKSNHPDYPDGGQKRDFVFVDDCIDHMLWLRQHPEVTGIFNSGTGRARTFDDLARAVFAALGREPNIRYIDMPAQLEGRYQYYTQAEMSKIRAAGYDAPPTELEDGVRRCLAKIAEIEAAG